MEQTGTEPGSPPVVDPRVLDALPWPAAAVDADGKVTYWNAAMQTITGRPATEVLGKRSWAGFCSRRKSTILDEALDQGEAVEEEISFVRGQGQEETRVVLRAIPVLDETGQPVGAVATVLETQAPGDEAAAAAGSEEVDRVSQALVALARGEIPPRLEGGGENGLGSQLNGFLETFQKFVDALGALHQARKGGDLESRIPSDELPGVFERLALQVNEVVGVRDEDILKILGVLGRYAKGDFEPTLEPLPGKLTAVSETMGLLRTNLRGVTSDLQAVSQAMLQGALSTRAETSKYEGEWATLLRSVNAIMDSIVAPLQEASSALQRLAARDLRVRIQGGLRGDHACIRDAVNATATSLHDALVQVAEEVDQMTHASTQIASSSRFVAQGASQQAAAIEETSSSIEEMAGMTAQTADNTQQAKVLAEASKESADKATRAMGQMLEAMRKIRTAAEGTAVIIRDINEIAFQTNLLALNAAVEAARAGDAGRGFAVVAEEVRSLAQRAKEAARKTEELIKESVKLAETGQEISSRVNGNLSEIAESVSKVTGIVTEIAAASQEQARGIEQVNKALAEIDKVTQQNAANSEQSSAAAQELAARAQELSALVGQFQITRRVTRNGAVAKRAKALAAAGKSEAARGRPARESGNGSGDGHGLRPEDVIPLDSDPDLASF
jgi:methyl-accepting chemotaxis protein